MTVICQACQALNRDKAMFCRGCAAKLPAFAATGPSALETLAPARPRAKAPVAAPPRQGLMVLPGARGWFAAVVLMSAALVALLVWITLAPTRTAAIVPAAAVPPAPLAAPAAAAPLPASPAPLLPSPAAPAAVVPFESALAPGETPADRTPAAVAPPAPRPANTARVGAAPGKLSTAAGRADPRVGCEHLFFAFAARCEASHCAEPAYARHPRCDAVREQRRRDEARRNLTSGY